MKIKRLKRYLFCAAAAAVCSGVVGIAAWTASDDTDEVKAYNNDGIEYSDFYERLEGHDVAEGEFAEVAAYEPGAVVNEGSDSLGKYYDARDHYNVRTKNQHSEGLCWLYSGVTALEYYLAKTNRPMEVSVKHLDYQIIKGEGVYVNGEANPYFDRYLNASGAAYRTVLGTAGSAWQLVYGFINPLAVVSEKDFTDVLKKNDNKLASIEKYEDLWSLKNRDELLTDGAYAVKQNYEEVNDPSKVNYIVTGAKMVSYAYDEARTADSDVVKAVKNYVSEYGALKISARTTDLDKCASKRIDGSRVLYTILSDDVDCGPNHGMVIVGWDDDWEYCGDGKDWGECSESDIKKGAFILQNSWGENETDKMKWHLSYTSPLPWSMYFDSVESYDAYDHYYGPADYREGKIESGADENIFELSLDDNEQLEAIMYNELYGDHNYDVYVSPTGKASDFEKDGVFAAQLGITKYELANRYSIEGDYAVKLKRTDGSTISDASKGRNVLNVLADKVWKLEINNYDGVTFDTCRVSGATCNIVLSTEIPVRDGHYFLGYADTASATVAKYQPGDTIMLSADKAIYALWADGEIEWKENQTYTKASGNDVVLRINYPLDNFVTLKIDGVELDNATNDKYKLEFGSTVITVFGSYLDTLAAGDHTIQAVYDNGVVKEANFTINEIDDVPSEDEEEISEDDEELPVPNTAAVTPNTGGNTTNNVGGGDILIYALPVSCVVLAGGIFITKRNKSHRKFD